MRCCVLGKDTLRLFPIDAKQSIPVVVVRPDKKLRKKTNKYDALRRSGLTDAECLLHTNETETMH